MRCDDEASSNKRPSTSKASLIISAAVAHVLTRRSPRCLLSLEWWNCGLKSVPGVRSLGSDASSWSFLMSVFVFRPWKNLRMPPVTRSAWRYRSLTRLSSRWDITDWATSRRIPSDVSSKPDRGSESNTHRTPMTIPRGGHKWCTGVEAMMRPAKTV
jgi:hypothetical protein